MKENFKAAFNAVKTDGFPTDLKVDEKPKTDEPAETIQAAKKVSKKPLTNDSESTADENRVVLKFNDEIFARLTALRIKNMNKGKLPSAQQLITDLLIKHLNKEGV